MPEKSPFATLEMGGAGKPSIERRPEKVKSGVFQTTFPGVTPTSNLNECPPVFNKQEGEPVISPSPSDGRRSANQEDKPHKVYYYANNKAGGSSAGMPPTPSSKRTPSPKRRRIGKG